MSRQSHPSSHHSSHDADEYFDLVKASDELSEGTTLMLEKFRDHEGVRGHEVERLENVLLSSEYLRSALDEAIEFDHLNEIVPLSAQGGDINAGGMYDFRNKTLSLSLSGPDDQFNSVDLVFVIGHELQHAMDRQTLVSDQNAAIAEYERAISHPARYDRQNNIYDITAATHIAIESTREHEARAEIGGWNAVASTLHEHLVDRPPTLDEMQRMCSNRTGDFLQAAVTQTGTSHGFALRPGLTVNNRMQMSLSWNNIQSMKVYYADAQRPPGEGFGVERNTDYRNLTASRYVNLATTHMGLYEQYRPDQAHMIRLDMKSLHLSGQQLRGAGLYASERTAPMFVYDGSNPRLGLIPTMLHDGATIPRHPMAAATSPTTHYQAAVNGAHQKTNEPTTSAGSSALTGAGQRNLLEKQEIPLITRRPASKNRHTSRR
ncbi:hypothetical protein [Dyella sp.]|uniref:hypothetical protein n=1 Tax=Dyella sp. TaxID=1869338 RepID=UPI002ED202D2